MFATLLFTCVIILLTPFLWWYLTLRRYRSLDGIPGPPPKLFSGNAHLIGTDTVDFLNSFMRLHKEYGPVMKIFLGSRLHLMIIKPEYVEFFLNSTINLGKSSGYDLFKPWLGDGLLVSEGDKWRTRRKMITQTFHFKILEQFVDVFNKNVDILVSRLETKSQDGEPIIINKYVDLCSLDIICETAFGTSIGAQLTNVNIEYVKAVTGFLEIFTSRLFSSWQRDPILFRLSPTYKKYAYYLKTLHNFTNKIIQRRKEEWNAAGNQKISELNPEGIKKKAALLDMLLEESDSGANLTDEDIREEVDTFMFEGHDTASAAICFTLFALAKYPKIQKKVYEEMVDFLGADSRKPVSYNDMQELKYFDIVVKECMRMYPPVPLIERRLEKDTSLDDFIIPKGTDISIFLYGMCHNPEVFPSPEKFDPERFLPEKQATRHNFAYVPFSAGPRNCIGQKFVMLELKVALAKLLRRFEIKEVPEFVPQIGMCSVLKSKNLLEIYLEPRKVREK